ncbi:MarR family winged helix-turn-helix transcriptional regulator [Streptacidiphilus sp. N1-12]|uniref:MarR family winged helix-turn-helix transcriptional regulator n=2 Tax=Streptacidiphilus alkalitolerans TaxID=3342712 RepID=A0ABV6V7M3_9ACTN
MTVKISDYPDADPDYDLGVLISRLNRDFERELWRTLTARGFTDIGPRHGSVLAHLRPEGVRASDLARLSGQHKQVIGTIVDELEALGYAFRRPDPSDRRAKLVVPTERGQAELATAHEVIAVFEQRQAEVLGPARYLQFREALRDLAQASVLS